MSRFFTPREAVEIRLLANDDLQKRDRLRLLKWSKYVYQDINLSVVKKTIRKKIAIDKKTMTIDMPCGFLQLSSVNVVDKYGIEYPVYRNNTLFKNDDIVDVSETKHCGCEFSCNNKLCNIIKGYEAVISTKTDLNPDGSTASFECVDRKGVDGQGFFYEQLQYPERIYESNVWVRTELHTEIVKKCKVEVDENGCVCDTEENTEALCEACGIKNVNDNLCKIGGTAETPPDATTDTWIYYCNNKMDWFMTQCGHLPYCGNEFNNIYNISELGDRLIFPKNFAWDHVIVRWYEDAGINDIQIPAIALDTFVTGLIWWDCRFNDKKLALADKYGQMYATLKFGLLITLNKYRIKELGKIMAPPVFVPSYIIGRGSQYEGALRNYLYYGTGQW